MDCLNNFLCVYRAEWENLEKILYFPAKSSKFIKYLENYCGHAKINRSIFPEAIQIEQYKDMLLGKLAEMITAQTVLESFPSHNNDKIQEAFEKIESSINLSLYYWYGKEDRNYQFRTLIHYFGIEDSKQFLMNKGNRDYFLFLSEHGVRIGTEFDEHIPKIFPVTKALGLEEFSKPAISHACENPQEQQLLFKRLFARIRTIAREICLIEEEWEYRNSLLSLDFTELRDKFKKNPTKAQQEQFMAFLKHFGAHRDVLALWCLQSFSGIQAWLAEISALPLLPDLHAEINALDAVILSGLQKIFLPATVSRHRYSMALICEVRKWATARLAIHKDDLTTALLKQQLDFVIDNKGTLEALDFLDKKSFEWVLSSDPCAVLKGFSWGISQKMHFLHVAVVAIIVARKLCTKSLDINWLVKLYVLGKMPEVFALESPSENNTKNLYEPSQEMLQKFIPLASEEISKIKTDEDLSFQQKNYLLNMFSKVLEEKPDGQ